MQHASEKSVRYLKSLSKNQCYDINEAIKNGEGDTIYKEDEHISHIVVKFDGIYYIAVYDMRTSFIITFLPPIAIGNFRYNDNHDYFYRDGKIIDFSDMLNRVYFQLFREYM